MTLTPQVLRVRTRFEAASLQEACRTTLRVLEESSLRVTSWAVPVSGPARTDDLLGQLGRPGALGQGETLRLELTENVTAALGPAPPHWSCELAFHRTQDAGVHRRLLQADDLCLGFAQESVPASIVLQREAGGAACLPWLPLVGRQTHVVLLTREQIARAYEDVDAFLACWQPSHEHQGRLLLTRALDAVDNVQFLEAVLDGQWAMARNARPRLTRYELLPPEPEEEPIYRRGQARVLAVGYDPERQLAEYTCHVEPDEHVHGW